MPLIAANGALLTPATAAWCMTKELTDRRLAMDLDEIMERFKVWLDENSRDLSQRQYGELMEAIIEEIDVRQHADGFK